MIDGLYKELSEANAKEATIIYELLLVSGADPEVAKLKVAELYSPPRVTRELQRLPPPSRQGGPLEATTRTRGPATPGWRFARPGRRRGPLFWGLIAPCPGWRL